MSDAKKVHPVRGELWYVDLNPTRGHEQAKMRPYLIISANRLNKSPAGLVTVLPLTTTKREIPWWVAIKWDDSLSKSFIMCEQIRTISKQRLLNGKPLGFVDQQVLDEVNQRLRYLLVV